MEGLFHGDRLNKQKLQKLGAIKKIQGTFAELQVVCYRYSICTSKGGEKNEARKASYKGF